MPRLLWIFVALAIAKLMQDEKRITVLKEGNESQKDLAEQLKTVFADHVVEE